MEPSCMIFENSWKSIIIWNENIAKKKKVNNGMGMLRTENILYLPLAPSLKESPVDMFQERGKLCQKGEKELWTRKFGYLKG